MKRKREEIVDEPSNNTEEDILSSSASNSNENNQQSFEDFLNNMKKELQRKYDVFICWIRFASNTNLRRRVSPDDRLLPPKICPICNSSFPVTMYQ